MLVKIIFQEKGDGSWAIFTLLKSEGLIFWSRCPTYGTWHEIYPLSRIPNSLPTIQVDNVIARRHFPYDEEEYKKALDEYTSNLQRS